MSNTVEHPDYYNSESGLEVFDIINGYKLNFYLGNAVKYICRAGKKDPKKKIEDLRKAEFYLKTELSHLDAMEYDADEWGRISLDRIRDAFELREWAFRAMERIINSRLAVGGFKIDLLTQAEEDLHEYIEFLTDLEKTK